MRLTFKVGSLSIEVGCKLRLKLHHEDLLEPIADAVSAKAKSLANKIRERRRTNRRRSLPRRLSAATPSTTAESS